MAKCAMYTCDICGDHYEGKRYDGTIFSDNSYSSRITISDYGVYSKDKKVEFKNYDLCPCCMTRVRNYINNLVEEQSHGVCLCPLETGTLKRIWWRKK